MTTEEFNAVIDNTCDRVKNILKKKAEEYAYGDRLSNFHRAAALLSCTPEQALQGMLTKHIISIFDMIDALPESDEPEAQWDEKIIDIVAYMILLRALNDDRINGSSNLAGTTLYATPVIRKDRRIGAYGLTLKEKLNQENSYDNCWTPCGFWS